jgi:hypothetical protein
MIFRCVIGAALLCALLVPATGTELSDGLRPSAGSRLEKDFLESSTLVIVPDWLASFSSIATSPSTITVVNTNSNAEDSIEAWVNGLDSIGPLVLGLAEPLEQVAFFEDTDSIEAWVEGLDGIRPFDPGSAEPIERVALFEDSADIHPLPPNPTDFYRYRRRFELPSALAFRGGWWFVSNSGAKVKTGEYQSLRSSEFWDADGLYSNGYKTVDFSVTGLDSEATNTGLRYYGPHMSANIQYERFLRRLDHDPLNGMVDSKQMTPGGPFASGEFVTKEDLNVDDDYAIRVQEFDAKFKGHVTDNLKWRLGVWGMRKKGERQVNAVAHCFNDPNAEDTNGNPVFGSGCHVLTQGQRIDWVTTELKPALEATIGSATVEYERTMRALDQNDQVTTRPYDNFGFSGDLPYAVVPENFTQIDRVKANVLLAPQWDFYSQYYTGNTKNKFRNTNRRISGFDLRTTAWSREGISVTGYAKKNRQSGQLPSLLLPEESLADLRPPINYDQTIAGLKGRWRLGSGNYSRRRMLLSAGYEFRQLGRENAIFSETFSGNTVTVNESLTTTNRMNLRGSMKWSPAFESHVRYRLDFTKNPLYGIAKNGTTNTLLPTQEHNIELGSTWTPADNFLLTATLGIINRSNRSEIGFFQEDDYPILLTAWYAPQPRWTFSGGLAFYSNWIDQDITLGGLSDPITSQWNYAGRSNTVNFGSTYAWTDCLTLSGGYEYVYGSNRFKSPTLWPDLPLYSNVLVGINRWTAGLDYQITPAADFYFRYQFFDYEDKTKAYNSGTANMFLIGLQAIF